MLLNVRDRGDGPAVVLLHGYPLNRTMWDELADSLSRRYRVITPDLPGHGDSKAPAGIYRMGWMAESVLQTLGTLRVDGPFVIGGLSMGGYVAQAMAVEHGERLRGLILMNTRAAADTPEQASAREKTASEVVRTGDVGAIAGAMIPRLLAPESAAGNPGLVHRIEAMILGTPPAGISGALLGMAAREDRIADLPRIGLPTLVVAGDRDAVVPLAEAEAMAAALPKGRLVVVPDVGHLAPIESPTIVFEAVERFLGDLG
ncbi:MAG: alpha/beta fold hydrolase [Isosphaeraceae bacterium]